MKKRFSAFVPAGLGLLMLAGEASAEDVTVAERAAFLACYRQVLAYPEFALMDSAALYRIREDRLAKAVLMACADEIRPYGLQLLKAAVLAPSGSTPGALRAPKGSVFVAWEAGLRRRVAVDLVEAAPRVKPFAEADPANAPNP